MFGVFSWSSSCPMLKNLQFLVFIIDQALIGKSCGYCEWVNGNEIQKKTNVK